MLNFLPALPVGAIAAVLMVLNALFWVPLLLVFSLLKPKAGGMALALNAMGDKFQAILDITIVYPDGTPTFWHFLQGKMRRVVVRARLLPIPGQLLNADYTGDPAVRAAFQAWVQELWREKDAQISQLLKAS